MSSILICRNDCFQNNFIFFNEWGKIKKNSDDALHIYYMKSQWRMWCKETAMPTHYLIVYENRSALGQQSISKQIVSKTYFTRQFGMTILLNMYGHLMFQKC